MRKLLSSFLVGLVGVCLLVAPGCNQSGGGSGWDINQAAPIIRSTTALITRAAFSDPRIAPNKDEICTATATVVNFLNNYDKPDATFDQLKSEVLNAVRNLDNVSEQSKQITLAVTEFVLDSTWLYIRDNYLDLVNNNQSQVVLVFAKAVANGIQQACGVSPSSLNANEPLTTYLDRYTQ